MDPAVHSLSIITVALNEEGHVARLKHSIDHLVPVEGVRVETVLVDGGSKDATVEEAAKAGFDQILHLPGDRIPVCRNAGAAAAAGEWLAYVDAECELSLHWLTEAAGLLKDHSSVIAGWPAQPPSPGTWVQRVWHIHWSNKNPGLEQFQGRHVVRHEAFRLITTRNMVLTRAALDDLNGFDEALPTGEDTDLVFRAYHQGIPVLGVPELAVIHHGEPATLRAFFRQQLWHANRTAYRRILGEQRGAAGANAPRFTFLFIGGLLLLGAGLLFALLLRSAVPAILGFLPLFILVGAPAWRIAQQSGSRKNALPLAVLYAAYGLARSLDLIGFARAKKSWKSG